MRHIFLFCLTVLMMAVSSFSVIADSPEATEQPQKTHVVSVAWSPDGNYIATGNSDGTVAIWDSTGSLLFTLFGHDDLVTGVVWNPIDSNQLASSSVDRTIKIWDVSNQELVTTLTGSMDTIFALAWNPDGSQLASVTEIDDHLLRIWDTATWQIQLLPRAGTIESVSWSPDGNKLALASVLGIGITSRADDYNDILLEGQTGMPISVSWSPDGSRLVSGGYDYTVRVWDGENKQPLATLIGHTDRVVTVAYSPDGKYFASGSWDGTIRIWDSSTFSVVQVMNVNPSTSRLAWSPDSTKIVHGNDEGTVTIESLNLNSEIKIPTIPPQS